MARLQRLAQLQSRILRSGFVDIARREAAQRMDALAMAVETRGHLLESIDRRNSGVVEKVQALLKLITGGVLTEGTLITRAREMILPHLSRPGFLTSYSAAQVKDGGTPDSEKAKAELLEALSKAGITAETGLKNIAA